MNKSALEVNRLNLRNMKVPYVITGVFFLAMLVQDVIKVIIAYNGGTMIEQFLISIGNYLWLVIPLTAIYIPTKNFRRLINLGCKRNNFFMGSLATYLILAGIISLANTLIFYTYDRFISGSGYFYGIFNCLEIFRWSANGPVLAFIQQFAFLFLVAAVIHTLVLMQDNWAGWVVDLLIIAVLSVFIPIASLRVMLLRFFDLIIFNSNAILQIVSCLMLAVVIYILSLPVLSKKRI